MANFIFTSVISEKNTFPMFTVANQQFHIPKSCFSVLSLNKNSIFGVFIGKFNFCNAFLGVEIEKSGGW